MTVETGIEKAPREECRKEWCCSTNNLMELSIVKLYVGTEAEADLLVQ
jgi:hypothetical protein